MDKMSKMERVVEIVTTWVMCVGGAFLMSCPIWITLLIFKASQ